MNVWDSKIQGETDGNSVGKYLAHKVCPFVKCILIRKCLDFLAESFSVPSCSNRCLLVGLADFSYCSFS